MPVWVDSVSMSSAKAAPLAAQPIRALVALVAAAAVPARNATVPTAVIFAAPLTTLSMALPSLPSRPVDLSASLPWSLVALVDFSSCLAIFSACLPASFSPPSSSVSLSCVSSISWPHLFMAVVAVFSAVCSVLTCWLFSPYFALAASSCLAISWTFCRCLSYCLFRPSRRSARASAPSRSLKADWLALRPLSSSLRSAFMPLSAFWYSFAPSISI